MKSPYETKNYFYLHDIPFLPLAVRGNAVNCRIGNSKQKVFIPLCYFDVLDDKGIILKKDVNLEWFYWKKNTQNNIKRYLDSKGE